VREDRRPSLDVDAWTHQTAEQDVQVASAALLKGEEKRTPSVSSEQAAVLGTPSTPDTHAAAAPLLEGEELWGTATSSKQAAAPATPSTSNSPPVMPADPEATAQPCRRIRTRAHKPSCTAHDFQSGRVVHPGTSPPSSRAQSACCWGLRRRPRRSRGSDDSGRRCAGAHSKTSAAQRQHSRLETADADALKPCTLAEASAASSHLSWPHDHTLRAITEEALHPSQPAYIDALPPLSLHTPSTRERSGVPHHTREEARVAADTRLVHWEAAKRALHPPHLLACTARISHTPR